MVPVLMFYKAHTLWYHNPRVQIYVFVMKGKCPVTEWYPQSRRKYYYQNNISTCVKTIQGRGQRNMCYASGSIEEEMDIKLASTGRWTLGVPKKKMWSRVAKHVEKKWNGETKGKWGGNRSRDNSCWEVRDNGKIKGMNQRGLFLPEGRRHVFLQYWEHGETQWKGCVGKGTLDSWGMCCLESVHSRSSSCEGMLLQPPVQMSLLVFLQWQADTGLLMGLLKCHTGTSKSFPQLLQSWPLSDVLSLCPTKILWPQPGNST